MRMSKTFSFAVQELSKIDDSSEDQKSFNKKVLEILKIIESSEPSTRKYLLFYVTTLSLGLSFNDDSVLNELGLLHDLIDSNYGRGGLNGV